MNPSNESTTHALAAVERGQAYLNLGLYPEAASEFRHALELYPENCHRAVRFLQLSLLGEHKFEEALAVGFEWVNRLANPYGIIHMVGLLLNSLGRYEEVDAFLRQHEAHRREAYDMACSAARRGFFSEALVWLNIEFSKSNRYGNYVLGDSDLRSLWPALRHLASTRVGAHLLLTPALEAIRPDLKDARLLVGLDWNAIQELPADLHNLFRYDDWVANFRLDARAYESRSADVQRAQELRRTWWQASAAALRGARECALETVLATQPLYAAAQAEDGNITAARWHLQWALFHRPTMLPEFARMARPGPFAELVANLERLEEHFPHAVSHLMHVRNRISPPWIADAEAVHAQIPSDLSDEPDY